MENYKIDMLGVSEIRWTGQGRMNCRGKTVLYSGKEQHHTQGVGIFLSKTAAQTLVQETEKSANHHGKIHTMHANVTVVQVYAPTEVADDSEKDEFYDQLQGVIAEIPSFYIKLVMGDFNAKRELNVVWHGIRLSNTTPVYLGIHLDRTLCYKTHIEKTKMKVNARNNIIRKLANSKATTLRPSCLALCYSAAEYACPVWARSTHAHKLNPALHDCCRIISGCLKPTNLDSVHLLAGIAPPHIRRTVACRMERTRQTTDANCSITNQLLAD